MEMRERAKALIGASRQGRGDLHLPRAGRAHGARGRHSCLGLKPQFSILDSDDVTGILKDAGGSTDIATARTWQWTISKWKNMGLNAPRWPRRPRTTTNASPR
jgi:ATP-dependent DNA helicase Rep